VADISVYEGWAGSFGLRADAGSTQPCLAGKGATGVVRIFFTVRKM
jgi:hypothetical protein